MTTNSTFQGRWGFHPCSHDIFLKLKRLHKWYWEAVYDFHRWHRWQRKLPQNRAASEPKYCPLFVEDSIWYKAVRIRGVAGFRVYPKTVVDRGLVSLYHQSRVPEPQPPAPRDEATLRQIDTLHAAVSAYQQG